VPSDQRNPMKLVRIKGASKRTRTTRSLTVEEFQKFARHLSEPFRVMTLYVLLLGASHQRVSSAADVRRRLAERRAAC